VKVLLIITVDNTRLTMYVRTNITLRHHCVRVTIFAFYLQLLSETFIILTLIRQDIINVHRYSRKEPVILVRLIKLQFFPTVFRKILKHETSWNSLQWQPGYSMRIEGQTETQTAGHEEANSRFSQFRERD